MGTGTQGPWSRELVAIGFWFDIFSPMYDCVRLRGNHLQRHG
jgi:hypothetical protein